MGFKKRIFNNEHKQKEQPTMTYRALSTEEKEAFKSALEEHEKDIAAGCLW